MNKVVIVDAVRSPIGRHNGGLSSVRPDDLLADVLKALMDKRGDWMTVGEPLITHRKAGGYERNCWQEHVCHMVNDEFIDLLCHAVDDVEAGDYLDMVAALREEIARRAEGSGTLLRRYLDHLVPAMGAWVEALSQAR